MHRRGDDLPDVLQQMAQALWDASEVVPLPKRADLLRRAADRAASSVRLQQVPMPETTCLLGDILVAFGEHTWKARSVGGTEAGGGAGGVDDGAAARMALWHCRRALYEGYGEAMRVRSHDVSILCGMADALLDCGRLQSNMLSSRVDPVAAQPAAMADATAPAAPAQPSVPSPPPVQPVPPVPPPAEAHAEVDALIEDLTDVMEEMQVDSPMPLVMEPPEPPVSLPPLPSAAECLERAATMYAQVLEAGDAQWAAARVSRLDTMFNAACACALLRGVREDDCAKLLGALAAKGALRRAEVEADADLSPLVPTEWMQTLLGDLP